MPVQGESVVSGFYKAPVPGRVAVGPDGLEPDDHVDDAHDRDRALLVYQRGHYADWLQEIGRDLDPGTFGENLTVEAPPDAEFLVGDELRIGTTRLRVTQPRIPCRKMAVRLQEGEDFPNRYLTSGRLGFFCAVLEPGDIGSGDQIELVGRGEGGVSVTEVARTLYFHADDTERLQRLIALPPLPETLRAKARRLLARAESKTTGWDHDRPLLVAVRREEARDVVSLDLEDPAGEALPPFEAGQFLTLSLPTKGRDRPAQRSYTIVSRSESGAGYRIAVKRVRAPESAPQALDGLVSNLIHDTLAPGARVSARRPMGHFLVEPGARPVVLVSAGIGVTPMLAMLRQLRDCALGRDVYFFHGARSGAHHAFADEVEQLVATEARLHSHIAYSKPTSDDSSRGRPDSQGRLTPELIERTLPDSNADYYLCGPSDFIRDMADGLVARGVPSDRVRFEYFGAAPTADGDAAELGDPVHGPDGAPITVTFTRAGVSVPWRDGAFSVLALAESAGLRPDASCRTGLCASCVSTLDSGTVEYPLPPLQQVAEGEVLICCARPTSSLVLDL